MSNNDDQCGCGGDCCDFYPDDYDRADVMRGAQLGVFTFGLRDRDTGELSLLAFHPATPTDEQVTIAADLAMAMKADSEPIEGSQIPGEVWAVLDAHFDANPGPGSHALVPMPDPVRPRLTVVAGTADAESDDDSCADPHDEAILLRLLLAYVELDPDNPGPAQSARDAALADVGDCPPCLRRILLLAVTRLGNALADVEAGVIDYRHPANMAAVKRDYTAVASELMRQLDAAAALP